jgi:DNA-binding NtrC family response regulator
LNREGHRVVGFNKPQDAIEELLKVPDKYDAVLLDFKIPEISGLEWLRHIRMNGQHHPVALVSGVADLNDAQNPVNQELAAM